MTTQLTALAAAILTVLTLGVGAAIAAPHDGAAGWESHDTMHTSASMRAMHEQMPDGLRDDCDAMHTQMSSGMGASMGQMHTSPYRR